LTSDERKEYLALATKIQDNLTVSISAISVRINTYAGIEDEYTIIRKRIALQDPANNVFVVEDIPKEVAEDVSDITFSSQPVVLESDPVVAYTFSVLEQQEYKYWVKKIVSLEDVKRSRTFVYPPIAPKEVIEAPVATGQVTMMDKFSMPKLSTDAILIIVGAIIITCLGAYYVSLGKQTPFKGVSGTAPIKRSRYLNRAVRPVVRIVQQRVQTTPSLRSPSSDMVAIMLKNAELAVDHKDYHAALDLYKDALVALHKDADLQLILQEKTDAVYKKLMLYRYMAEAHHAAETNNKVHLKKSLELVREAASHIGDRQSVLMQEAKASYAKLSQRLNNLEIQEGKY
jgi:hypothetical protein